MILARELVDFVMDFESFITMCKTEYANRLYTDGPVPSLEWGAIADDLTEEMPSEQVLLVATSDPRSRGWSLSQVARYARNRDAGTPDPHITFADFAEACIRAAARDALATDDEAIRRKCDEQDLLASLKRAC